MKMRREKGILDLEVGFGFEFGLLKFVSCIETIFNFSEC